MSSLLKMVIKNNFEKLITELKLKVGKNFKLILQLENIEPQKYQCLR
jgi:hypothetical protein